MAIKRTVGNTVEPGEHRAQIIEVSDKDSKTGKKMLTLRFETESGGKIADWFLKDQPWRIAQLTEIKKICGLKIDQSAKDLLGKRLGIAVEMRKGAEGTDMLKVTGYGLESDVTAEHSPNPGIETEEDSIPF